MPLTLDTLRRYAVARSLFKPTTLGRAIKKLGFVQADPIRAPARAQDLTLRHRVRDYCAGDLERLYPKLALEEDFFVNYGFVPRALHELMHPRVPPGDNAAAPWMTSTWTIARAQQAEALLAFIRERGVVHPREVDAHFAHGKAANWFGGSSNASTQLLDTMHYRGMLRVARRVAGTRVYAARAASPQTQAPTDAQRHAAIDALADVAIRKYAPLPAPCLGFLLSRLRYGVPQWAADRAATVARAKQRLKSARLDGVEWYWPAEDTPQSARWRIDDAVRLLTPFDPIVWDRRRFEMFWGWAYRFEAYTPAPKRKLGYYALPLLWHGRVIGWGNVAVADGGLKATFGYIGRAPRDAKFRAGLESELELLRAFLNKGHAAY
ncbi:MAG TPA: crosslink repair DNA glycosylase YcaQ family protein [Steroidobacteraceae bacterium]|nr:crosslink repair DNA glycosylase YcaQ family protein [Steroidobacteraceae bacterium]